MIISIANSGESPLSPLFQRGELAVERAELPNTNRAKLYLPSWIIPPLKKGDKKGDLNFFTASGLRVRGRCQFDHPHLIPLPSRERMSLNSPWVKRVYLFGAFQHSANPQYCRTRFEFRL
jgi:hypothetical protein